MSTSTPDQFATPPGLTPELMQWIRTQSAAGVPLPALLNSMRTAGWAEHLARRALALPEVGELPVPFAAPATIPLIAAKQQSNAQPLAQSIDQQLTKTASLPEPDLQTEPCCIDAGDRQVHVLTSMRQPRVVVFGNLLSDEECDAIIAAASPRMQRSLTVDNQSGGEALNDDRTSNGMFFKRGELDLISRIEARIARLLNWPIENGEGLQVLHYRPGAEYKPHYDYFAPNEPGTPTILKRGGQRVGTLVMYLNEPTRGGATTFPDVGLQVVPRRGNAVFFSYDRPDPGTQTLHGGAPVLEGEKWIATKWLREREFK
ncbi:2OG-Fe(II) oxygenase [Comamonas sp. Y33R10-2]|uniref:2OG-Fe(II) oxygenase n=1 Tax=Comamonas sp. Y33R10-2 TaxID=2853257 RepID=UPI001C5CAE76|nr:2OG-Fe(II) oxygenase [Comamonas sp. Y33R10-2]QXZ10069.1 2OG-Fe(II) oxygenase [Comamonas sp. Y33R10-2]